MTRINLDKRINSGFFLLDGAMGTQLFARGIEAGRCGDLLNVESPDVIGDIHKAYIAAGSDAVFTNTFGANKIILARHGLADRAAEINAAAVKIARKAAGEDKYVLGDIGPCGDFLEPLGTLTAESLKQVFAEQAKILCDSGVDGFIIETMTALDEMLVAIDAVKSVCNLPVFASMSFDKAGDDFRTMMGVGVEDAAAKIISFEVAAVGFNCGKASLDEYVTLAAQFVSAVNGKTPVLAEPNAGLPELVDNRAVYKVSAEEFAQTAEKIHSAGVNIIGGCCGTSPEHIKAVADKFKSSL